MNNLYGFLVNIHEDNDGSITVEGPFRKITFPQINLAQEYLEALALDLAQADSNGLAERRTQQIYRHARCPCGSGKQFHQCGMWSPACHATLPE